MPVEGPIWERYDRATRGPPVDETGDFQWMLESPGEFELRVLVRNFDARDELLDRIGRFEHEPSPEHSDADLEKLGASLGAAYKRVAAAHTAEDFAWADSTEPMEVRIVPAATRGPKWNDTRSLHEEVNIVAQPEISATTGARALELTLEDRAQTIGLYYLLGPLLSCETDFWAALALYKSGTGYWIEDGQLCIRKDTWLTRWNQDWPEPTGWEPQLDWPTDADIADHQAELVEIRRRGAIAKDPETPPHALLALLDDPSEKVRSKLALNPNAADSIIEQLSINPSEITLHRILQRNTSIPADAIALALAHKSRRVRTRLAERPDLDPEIRGELEQDQDLEVRKALANNPAYTDD